MGKHFRAWVLWFIFLLVIDFTVPFLIFGHVPRLSGSFLFWVAWVIVAIISMFIMFAGWRENNTQGSSRP
ncbi:MAG: hypothetical protein PHP23_03235 [Desulfobacterales bacterium]|nr:hypothetical protein [Desulfobacterales bacterium]MDD4072572.1 hypothetical protein [Desulfobacterales bacterium]MDD4393862.1 hypothetical protein [Desulfobacterales bacterium]